MEGSVGSDVPGEDQEASQSMGSFQLSQACSLGMEQAPAGWRELSIFAAMHLARACKPSKTELVQSIEVKLPGNAALWKG